MFVLCLHCHFLVGIDPRTGAPPGHCPKCGGVVVAALPEPRPEQLAKNATALEPFAQVALPSVAPTLPEPVPEAIAADIVAAPVPAPAEPEPEPEPEPAAAPIVAIEAAPTVPERKPRWWSRRKDEQPAAATPAAPAEVVALPAATVASSPADTRVATAPVRPRATKQSVQPAAPIAASSTVIEPVEVAIGALPPAVQVEDVVAATPPAPDEAVLEPATETATQGGALEAGTLATIETVDSPPPGHPLRRHTDTAAGAWPDSPNHVPPTSHPLRRRTDAAAPSFTRPRVRAAAASRTRWRGIGALAGLSLLLVLQLLLAQRDTLAANPRWRPTISTLCATLRCTLPPWREPAAFTMLSRDVRPHPGAPGTLLINASFRNDARWPQPWPSLLLTLSDLDGRMVGARAFAAREYLGATPTQSALASGQTAAVSLVVVEPAPDIVAFTFDFR